MASATARYALLRYARELEPGALPKAGFESLGWLPWDEGASAVSPLTTSRVTPELERCAEDALRDVWCWSRAELAEHCNHIDHLQGLTGVLGRVAGLGLISEAAIDRTVRWSRGHRYDGEVHWVPPDAR